MVLFVGCYINLAQRFGGVIEIGINTCGDSGAKCDGYLLIKCGILNRDLILRAGAQKEDSPESAIRESSFFIMVSV